MVKEEERFNGSVQQDIPPFLDDEDDGNPTVPEATDQSWPLNIFLFRSRGL